LGLGRASPWFSLFRFRGCSVGGCTNLDIRTPSIRNLRLSQGINAFYGAFWVEGAPRGKVRVDLSSRRGKGESNKV